MFTIPQRARRNSLRTALALMVVVLILSPLSSIVLAQGYEIQWSPLGSTAYFPRYDYFDGFKDGRGSFSKGNFNLAYYDSDGNEIISSDPAVRIDADIISGLYRAKHEYTGKYGFCDANGKLVIPAVYDEVGAELFENGYCVATRDGWINVLDLNGNELLPDKTYAEGAYAVRAYAGGFICIQDSSVPGVYPPQKIYAVDGKSVKLIGEYDWSMPAGEGLLSVTDGTAYGAINKAGELVIPLTYGYWIEFHEGLAAVPLRESGRYVYLDPTGRQAFPGSWLPALQFVDGYAIVYSDDEPSRVGVIDKTGRQVLPYLDHENSLVEHFSEGMLIFYEGAKRGVANAALGRIVVEPQDWLIEPFSEGVATYGIETGIRVKYPGDVRNAFADDVLNVGLIDTEGHVVLPADGTYHKLLPCKDGMIQAMRYILKDLTYGSEGNAYTFEARHGYLNRRGEVAYDLVFQQTTPFNDGVAMARKDSFYGILKNPLPLELRQYRPATPVNGAGAATKQATPVVSNVMIDGRRIAFEAYSISDYTYFKLRDLAMALNESKRQFAVTWDEAKSAINLLSNQAYLPVGGELVSSGDRIERQATANTAKLYLDGKELPLNAYAINGSTYFKLRDLGDALQFGVAWDAAANTIRISTNSN